MARRKIKHVYKPPAGGATVTPKENKSKVPLDCKTEAYVDSLYNAAFQKHTSRPNNNLEGYFIVLRWYKFSTTWITYYVGEGEIRSELNRLFGSPKTPKAINQYLTSVSRKDRSRLLALKWFPYPDDFKASMKDIKAVIAAKYNENYEPPFNNV